MVIINGQTFNTVVDAAEALGVSAKTVGDYVRKGIIPPPPEIQYGVRVLRHYPKEYLRDARKLLEGYRRDRIARFGPHS
ncbi:MAG: helix-turn-helix domain-containing protein [Syntrophales bacterium]